LAGELAALAPSRLEQWPGFPALRRGGPRARDDRGGAPRGPP
jgi:hypothetical protein